MTAPIRMPWLFAALSALCPPPLAAAGTEAGVEDELKAGFVLNFTMYTEWPAGVLGGHDLLICSVEPRALSGRLETLQGRTVSGRSIRVLVTSRPSEWNACQVLFIDADARHRPDAVPRALGLAPVLTVSDAPGFIQAGGMIGLKLRGGRIRFEINQGAARESGLVLSSQLLKLADTVLP